MKSHGKHSRTLAEEAAAYDKLIPLLNFDEVTGQIRWKVTINSRAKAGDLAGSRIVKHYRSIRFEGRKYSIHRLWFYQKNGYLPLIVDHIKSDLDADGFLDNRPDNLRAATQGENMYNRSSAHKNSSTGVKGVYPSSNDRSKPYRVQINADGKRHRLGYCDNVYQGAIMYNAAARKLHGEFHQPQACINGLWFVK